MPSTSTRNCESSYVRPASASAACWRRGSCFKRPGYSAFTIQAHNPEGTTTCTESANRSTEPAATASTSSPYPQLYRGMPQQVCPSGKSSVTPSGRRSCTIATPTSGKNTSPRQVIMIEAFIESCSTSLPPSNEPSASLPLPLGEGRCEGGSGVP